MCIVCRNRFAQYELIRLQCKKKELIFFDGVGRSFYVCKECLNSKKLSKKISYLCKISKEIAEQKIETIKKEYS